MSAVQPIVTPRRHCSSGRTDRGQEIVTTVLQNRAADRNLFRDKRRELVELVESLQADAR